MAIRILPDFLINQIAAGEVIERPASVVKELVENALDAGADQVMIDVVDGGRTLISVIDNGPGMSKDDLLLAVKRHATSKLPTDDLLNINYMGFRGEALPSIVSVSDTVIDTCEFGDKNGWQLDCSSLGVRPSDWEIGTRIRVKNLFSRTPARLKFLHSDRAEMMAVLDIVKRLAMSRCDVGFTLNNKWHFPKNQPLRDRITAVMGEDIAQQMLEVNAVSPTNSGLKIHGFISIPTLKRASSIDEYLFVNGRPVKDKILLSALRAAYADVMHAREFPLCALYLDLNPRHIDVNVSPAKTEVHFLEPSRVRAFIIKTLRNTLATTLSEKVNFNMNAKIGDLKSGDSKGYLGFLQVHSPNTAPDIAFMFTGNGTGSQNSGPGNTKDDFAGEDKNFPLGYAFGQIGNKYILAQTGENLIIVDQHAAHERIVYEKLRTHKLKRQPLLTPIVIKLRTEDIDAVLSVADEMAKAGLLVNSFGDDAVAISEKPADWDLDWAALLHEIADEVRFFGNSSVLTEKLHLKLANYACHHSVRAGQRLNLEQMNALLRDIENTSRGGECNHGRPVYKIIPLSEIDKWFDRT